MRDENCIFCKIAGHALILPKDHYADLFTLPEEKAEKVMSLARKMGTQIKDALHADGLNLVQNNGECAGQTVFHFHMHIIPRFKNDGQKIGWIPGKPSGEELEEVRKEIVGE